MEEIRNLVVAKLNELLKLGGYPQAESKGELLKQIPLMLGNIWQFSIEKFNQIIPPKKRSVFQEGIGNYLVETLNQLIQISKSRFNQILPPEILQQWAHVGLTGLLPICLVLFCLYLYCRNPGGGFCKMMKAPGRKGTVMPRATFVGNPSGYFHDLHAMKKKK